MSRASDQQQRLLGERGDHHQVDQFLLGDEEARQRLAEAVDPRAELLGFLLQFLEGPLFAAARG
jgi:hypothetical protein